jgi:uncharacterized protein YhaN
MPADLKLREVAEEIERMCYGRRLDLVESRLQTLVSEVRAQAMEEAAKIVDREQEEYRDDARKLDAMGNVVGGTWSLNASLACRTIAEAIRRRASGKDESNG